MWKQLIISIAVLLRGISCYAQEQELEQLALNIEKLSQFKSILSDMQKGYKVLTDGYEGIKAIASGNFSLHSAFLNGLLEVSPAVRNYKRVADIISMQRSIVLRSDAAYKAFVNAKFSAGELSYIAGVQAKLAQQGLDNLDVLLLILTPRKLRMADDERLRQIDKVYASVTEQKNASERFNRNCYMLSRQRAKEAINIDGVQALYGIKK